MRSSRSSPKATSTRKLRSDADRDDEISASTAPWPEDFARHGPTGRSCTLVRVPPQ